MVLGCSVQARKIGFVFAEVRGNAGVAGRAALGSSLESEELMWLESDRLPGRG